MRRIKLLPHNQEIVNKIEQAMISGIRKIFYTEATGLGKSFVFMYLVNKYFKDKKVLYICPKYHIWKHINACKEFGLISHCVDMCCYADFNEIKDRHFDYDVYFIDEAHHLFSDIQGKNIINITNSLIKKNKDAYVFGMTATPYYEDKMVGEEFFDVSVKGRNLIEAIEEKLLQPIEYAIAIDDIDRTAEEYKDIQEMKNYAKKYNVDTTKTTIKSLMNNYSHINHWLLYFSKIEELRENIAKFKKHFPEYKIFVLHSQVNDTETIIDEFEAYEGKAILASVSMILEGVHPKTVEGVLSYRNVHSRNLFLQMIGRLGIMNKDINPVFIDIYKSYRYISPPHISNDPIDNCENYNEYESKNIKQGTTFSDRFNKCILMHSDSYELIDFSNIIEKIYNPEYSYRGITWKSDRELSIKLGMNDSYVGKYIRSGKTYEQIIDQVLDNPIEEKSYRNITWVNDYDLSRKLGKRTDYVCGYRHKGLSYEEIIDQVLDNPIEEKSYRGITWIHNTDLSKKLGKHYAYVQDHIYKGESYEQIIDRVLDTEKSYKGITWINNRDLSIKLGKNNGYVSFWINKGLTYEQIIDQALNEITNSGSYRGITWINDYDLSIKLGKNKNYVHVCKHRGLSYEQIIDQVLDYKPNSYRGITWKSNNELSKKLGKDYKYIKTRINKGLSYEEIIDQVLDNPIEKSYRNITWKSDRELSIKLGKDKNYVCHCKHRGLSYEEIIDQVLGKQDDENE